MYLIIKTVILRTKHINIIFLPAYLLKTREETKFFCHSLNVNNKFRNLPLRLLFSLFPREQTIISINEDILTLFKNNQETKSLLHIDASLSLK